MVFILIQEQINTPSAIASVILVITVGIMCFAGALHKNKNDSNTDESGN